MAVRRLAEIQPADFAFSAENSAWADEIVAKFPAGRQASAVIPLLWRGQEQEGWVTKPMIEVVGRMLDMPFIRVLEVATFYTMFHLAPVGAKAHVQLCGTTPCMLRGSEDLKAVCRSRINAEPHHLSADGDFSWEEVECLGACVNAPMVQIFSDTYEDLTPESFEKLLDGFARGKPPAPGPQIKRISSAPASGLTSLTEPVERKRNAKTPEPAAEADEPVDVITAEPEPKDSGSATGSEPAATAESADAEPELYDGPPAEGADDLKQIYGVGPTMEGVLNELGFYRFDQIAAWSAENVAWVDKHLTFKGRIERDDWVGQAKTLSAGGSPDTAGLGRKKR